MLRNSGVKELVIGANQSLPIVRFFANSVTKTKKKKTTFSRAPITKIFTILLYFCFLRIFPVFRCSQPSLIRCFLIALLTSFRKLGPDPVI